MLIALAGLPGAGKSTLARGLQTSLQAEIVSRDSIRLSQFPDWEEAAAKRAAFEIVHLDAAMLLRAGATVIVDGATLARAAERQTLRELAAGIGVPFCLLWLDLPAALAAIRIAGDRNEAPADRVPAFAHAVAQRFEAPQAAEGALRLDACQPAGAVLEQALAAIRAMRAGHEMASAKKEGARPGGWNP